MGIKNLEYFNRALRFRWLWQRWVQPDKPWVHFPLQFSETEQKLFQACTSIVIGNGQKTRSCNDRWLQGQSPREIAPICVQIGMSQEYDSGACFSWGQVDEGFA
jgi:hypothetical protein